MLGSSARKWPVFLVLLLGVAIIFILLRGPKVPPPRQQAPSALVPVTTVDASLAPQTVALSSQGIVSPKTQSALMAEVSGVVRAVESSFEVGSQLKQGDVLLHIDDTDYRAALAQAKASLAAAEQSLATEKAQARQAKREWRDLGSDEANAVFLREPHVRAAKANAESAALALKSAQYDLTATDVRMPFNGMVREKQVDLGQYVTVGTPLATVYASDSVEIRLPLSLSQRARLKDALRPSKPAVTVEFSADYGGEVQSWTGQLLREEGSLDPQSRQVYLVAQISDPFVIDDSDRLPLKLGQYLRASITLPERVEAFRLPRKALRQQNQIWVVDADSKLRKLTATVLQYDDKEVLLSVDGYNELRAIVSDLSYAVDGMPVATDSPLSNANKMPVIVE